MVNDGPGVPWTDSENRIGEAIMKEHSDKSTAAKKDMIYTALGGKRTVKAIQVIFFHVSPFSLDIFSFLY